MRRLIIQLINFLFQIIFRFYFRLGCEGCDQLSELQKSSRPIIIVFNHSSHLDVPAVCLCLGVDIVKKLVFPAKAELLDNMALVLFKQIFPTIPLQRDGLDVSSVKQIISHLKQGKSILISPEGTRSLDGKQLEYNTNFLKLARISQAVILPTAVTGTYQALPKGKKFPSPAKITVSFLDILDISNVQLGNKHPVNLSDMIKSKINSKLNN